MSDLCMHYVCTREEARGILARLDQDRFWVSNCGCREDRGRCSRSRHDVCLAFQPGEGTRSPGSREVSRAGVDEILGVAEDRHLVMRPYRDDSRENTIGFCVCCDDCCDYFLRPAEEHCDKGAHIESTDRALCTDCGDCTAVCYFCARTMVDGQLTIDRQACYGCGLCRDVCAVDCIVMAPRP